MGTLIDFKATFDSSKAVINHSAPKRTKLGKYSLAYYLGLPSTHHLNIKLGALLEERYRALMSSLEGVTFLSDEILCNGGSKEESDLFFQSDSTIYYFEVKANPNLDSEKAKVVAEKISRNLNLLKSEFPSYSVKGGLFVPTNKQTNHIWKKQRMYSLLEFLKVTGFDVSKENIDEYDEIQKEFLKKAYNDADQSNLETEGTIAIALGNM